ncbi:sugar phosphate isomerase/epimerase [Bradyrhizobium lablabi]|uniref:sugar phosphate isomerase/epimerase family protein n=1 Tax=Bradyrhizobium lablabi TaxID=722472 RepID=UPI001BAC8748|nr:sugar phosphate isomerase/epimerase family protein [Bradyrhizobium lablabi]MBR0693191.1 sugar phosphate isomerase/epimerase [Bradyrhizobium lablabi]
MKPKTIRGPGLFISQFIGAEPPFDTLSGLAEWAQGLGFKALQIPVSDPRLKDLADLPDREAISKIEAVMSKTGLDVSEIAAQRSGQLLAVHPAYDETMDVLASPDVRGRPAARRELAVQDLRWAIARAAVLGTGKVVTFSGGLAWPYLYPYPPRPAGLVERAFDELARRWRPLLDEADRANVDLCFELHPGQDLHDGITFERFLGCVDHHPRVKINYDPSHFLLQQMDYLGFIDRYHQRIGAFHVKDAEFRPGAASGVYGGYQDWLDRPGRFRSVGDGQIDFGGIFDRLTRYSYDGWAVLEWECCLKNSNDGAREGARFIDEHIIRVSERSFDAALGASMSADRIDLALGLARRP